MRPGIGKVNNVFKLYDSETGEALDGTVSVTLPNFELLTETYKGAGVAAEVNVPTGIMNAMTAVISCPKVYGAIMKYLELGSTRTLDLRNEIIVQNPDTHAQEKVPDRWVIKGPLSGSNPGNVEQAASGDASITMQVYYVHHWMDGDDKLEWDPFKFIYTVDGVDLMATSRQNVLVG